MFWNPAMTARFGSDSQQSWCNKPGVIEKLPLLQWSLVLFCSKMIKEAMMLRWQVRAGSRMRLDLMQIWVRMWLWVEVQLRFSGLTQDWLLVDMQVNVCLQLALRVQKTILVLASARYSLLLLIHVPLLFLVRLKNTNTTEEWNVSEGLISFGNVNVNTDEPDSNIAAVSVGLIR